jgi:hypothetical protein
MTRVAMLALALALSAGFGLRAAHGAASLQVIVEG